MAEWIVSNKDLQSTSFAGEIEISEQVKTLTVRKKKMDNTIVKIDYLIFEKEKD